MNQGLILVDVQNDYFSGGNMELVGMEQAASRAQGLLRQFRDKRQSIFHVRHISNRPGATFFLPGTKGAEIHEAVAPLPEEPVVEKHFPNSFRETSLLDRLRDSVVEEIVICGAMSHMCIDATTRAAFDLGFRCTVIEDACATRDLKHRGETIKAVDVHAAFMAALATPYATVVPFSEFASV